MVNHPNRSKRERRYCAKAGCNKRPNGIFSFCTRHNAEAIKEMGARAKAPLTEQHPCYRGQRVAVLNSAGGKIIIEGYGFIRSAVLGVEHQYRVQFHDGVYERFVDPAAQLAPEEYVASLNARAGTS